MRKTLSIALVLALVLALATPSLAFAGKGGVKGPGEDSGKGRPVAGASDEGDQTAGKSGKVPGSAAGIKKPHEADESADTEETTADSEESDAVKPGKKTGISTALTRVSTTLTRMQTAFDSGLRKQLPPGLTKVFAKFLGWLGFTQVEDTWTWVEEVPEVGESGGDGAAGTEAPSVPEAPTDDVPDGPLPVPDPV